MGSRPTNWVKPYGGRIRFVGRDPISPPQASTKSDVVEKIQNKIDDIMETIPKVSLRYNFTSLKSIWKRGIFVSPIFVT